MDRTLCKMETREEDPRRSTYKAIEVYKRQLVPGALPFAASLTIRANLTPEGKWG